MKTKKTTKVVKTTKKTKSVAGKLKKTTVKGKKTTKVKLDKTHIVAILDQSGSMTSVAPAAISGFNEFLQTQKAIKGKATMDVLLFSDPTNIKYVSQNADIKDVKELTSETYTPNGSTALFDAIAAATTNYKLLQSTQTPSKKADKVLVVIITDGEENASKEYPRNKIDEIKALITKRKSENWQFIFLCSTENAVLTGQSLGVSRGNTMQFMNTNVGNQAMYSSVANAATVFRGTSLKSKSFSKTSENLLSDDND